MADPKAPEKASGQTAAPKIKNVELIAVNEIILPDDLGTRQAVAPGKSFKIDAENAKSLVASGAAKHAAKKADEETPPA